VTTHTYTAGRRNVVVDEREDVLAVRPEAELASVPFRSWLSWPEADPDGEMFHRAGWRLVPRNQAYLFKTRAQVLLRNGAIVLAPNRMVVKFADHCHTEDIDSALRQAGFETLEVLRFARNLRVVAARAAAGAVDVFESMRRLRDLPGCEKAEPDLIEIMTARAGADEVTDLPGRSSHG
jgi:hypothetical protein